MMNLFMMHERGNSFACRIDRRTTVNFHPEVECSSTVLRPVSMGTWLPTSSLALLLCNVWTPEAGPCFSQVAVAMESVHTLHRPRPNADHGRDQP